MSAAAMAAISASSAAASSAAASRAKTESCKITVSTFDNLTATTEQKQDYADCIQRLHPSEMSAEAVLVAKACICILLVSLVVGLVRGLRDEGLGFDMFMTAMGHVLVAAGGLVAIGLAGAGIFFLIAG